MAQELSQPFLFWLTSIPFLLVDNILLLLPSFIWLSVIHLVIYHQDFELMHRATKTLLYVELAHL